ISEATGEIVVLSDSDTKWAENLLEEILKPFSDPEVAGVGAKQNVDHFEDSLVWRIENWLLDLRYIDFVPGMSVDGVVNCLSGRTAAYRRSLLLPVLSELVGETFLGKKCVGGDDVRLTQLMLIQGYKTVYQRTAEAYTVYSGGFGSFVRRKIDGVEIATGRTSGLSGRAGSGGRAGSSPSVSSMLQSRPIHSLSAPSRQPI